MKKKTMLIAAAVVLLAAIAVILIMMPRNSDYKKNLQFTSIEKGDIKSVVSCTGTINAKGTVEIGTQVSGTVSSVNADFNDNVSKSQILAVLDTTLLKIAVDQAKADLVKADNQYSHILTQYENNKLLHDDKLISDFDFEASRVSKEAAYSDKLSAEANLKRAQANLSNAIIRSPIDGTVIDRDVEVGQTVAASLSSPTLFIIAENLSNMEISALVDENDIGNIKLDQKVSFSVESYPDEVFSGKVVQIRLKPTTVSNVVNYTIIVDAPNPKRLLLPGMTANIDITVDERKDVHYVINAALKFKPTQIMMNDLKKNMESPDPDKRDGRSPDIKNPDNNGGSLSKNNGQSNGQDINNGRMMIPRQRGNPAANRNGAADAAQLYFLDKQDNIRVMMVRTGLTDGQKTEIVGLIDFSPELKIISGSSGAVQRSNSSQNRNFGPPRMF